MAVEHVEFLVEERSMEEALRGILPRIMGTLTFSIHPFRSKQNLLAQLPNRLHAYRQWIPESWRIFVLIDRDEDDCMRLKQTLEDMANQAGLTTRTAARGSSFTVVNRIVVEELESWYFGDWEAVRLAYPKVAASIPRKEGYRSSDAITGGTWEKFEKVMQRHGYFKGGLLKIEAAREIGRHIDPQRSTSPSFAVFVRALADLTLEEAST